MPPKTALEALLAKLHKGEQDYSDVPMDVIEGLARYESNAPAARSISNPRAWTILRAKAIKDAEETGILNRPQESYILPDKAIQNYKAQDQMESRHGLGSIDDLYDNLRLQDILRKK